MKKSNARKRSLFYTTAVFLLSLTFFSNQVVKADLTPHALTAGTPLLQDWTNIAMITVDNDWSGVPSIIGYRGDNLSVVTGTDPQTIVADGSATPVNVEANELNPDTFTTGGNAEFHITNPVVAFQGSGTADAPHLVATLNTTGCAASTNVINVSYLLRDIDTVSTAVQPVALQYRIGTSGNYTNLSSAFVANANLGTDTLVNVSLPLSLRGQTTIQVRWITSDAVGSDAFIGIDNINISCTTLAASGANIGGRVSTAKGRGIGKVNVTLSGGDLPEPRIAITNPFGYYQFDDVPVGSTYVLTVASKQYTFENPTRVFYLEDSLINQDFVAYAP